jgi:hypothetical protein
MKNPAARFLVTIFALAICFAVHAQESTNALPPDAQDAIDKGIIAAKNQDYLLAIRYFEDARKIAPNSPEIFYNLGLAESQIPGRELRAICWFGAFLTAEPNSPKAAAIKEQIKVLDVKSQSNISRLLQSAQDVATKSRLNGDDLNFALERIAELYIDSGDLTQGNSILSSIGIAWRSEKHNDWYINLTYEIDIAARQIDKNDANAKDSAEIVLAQLRALRQRYPDMKIATEVIRFPEGALLLINETPIWIELKAGDSLAVQNLRDIYKDDTFFDNALYSDAISCAGDHDSVCAQKAMGFIQNPKLKQNTADDIAKRLSWNTYPPQPPSVSQWISQLDNWLNEPIVLNTSTFLLTRQSSIEDLCNSCESLIRSQSDVDRMLKEMNNSNSVKGGS